jgi:hypothetical protein
MVDPTSTHSFPSRFAVVPLPATVRHATDHYRLAEKRVSRPGFLILGRETPAHLRGYVNLSSILVLPSLAGDMTDRGSELCQKLL